MNRRRTSLLKRLKSTVMGGTVGGVDDRDSLDQPNLRRQVVSGILKLSQRGPRGVDTLPPAVAVSVAVGAGSVDVVRSFIDRPEFDTDVGRDLLNRLVGIRSDALPVRLYQIEAAARTRVTVEESTAGVLAWLEIESGDRRGTWYPLKASQAIHAMGRGPWHGDDQLVPNDLVLSDGERFVSRRAAVLRRVGTGLEIEARDQGECLAVIRENRRRIRPTHVRSRSVRVAPGDAIEFNDGGSKTVRVKIHRQPLAGRDSEAGSQGDDS